MSHGSEVHDELGRHFRSCGQCRDAKPEEVRIRRPPPLRHSVPEATLATLCPAGRPIYQAYLCWLATPDDY